MNMIEVDTKLFITCRLCLEEFGMYQIVPSVQEQIKFCFDIDVQPFDGLPQLLCKKCEEILRDCHMKKKIFQGKQAALLEQVKGHVSKENIELESVLNKLDNNKEVEEAVTSSQINEENIEIDDSVSNVSRRSKNRSSRRSKNKSPKWWAKAGFSKQYQCRLCNKSFIIKSSINKHINNSHRTLMQKFKNIYSTYCNVNIEKFDEKPNKTGSSKTVVWDDHTVLQNVFNKNYYIKFSKIQTTNDNNLNESDSGDDISFKGNKTKRRRITSKDSTDTVVLDNNLVKPNDSDKELETNIKENTLVDTECISINDSSDSESIESHTKTESQFQEPDYKTIQSIISVCHHKYVNKIESQQNDSSLKKKKPANVENLLKHKILSIGRKVINKQGFNCNGILRFMDHKNLDIEWKPDKKSEEKKYIRILTQHKQVNKNVTNTHGWKNMNQFMEEIKDSFKISPDVNEKKTNSSSYSTNNHNEQNNVISEEANIAISEDSAVLFLDVDDPKKKILNQNPVANPKQLPKKIAEPKGKTKDQHFIELSVYDPDYPIATLQPINTEETLLPIITSTTSLVQITVEGDSEKDNQSDGAASEPAAIQPRIKVKPASELMAPRPPWSTNSNYPIAFNMPVRVTGTVPQYVIQVHNNPAQQQIANTSEVKSDNIMLHTVELPHCKTDTPFRYFQNLLQIHSIILLDCNAILTSDFICLIKFKVHYAEGAIDRPIVLCSSLMYLNNHFCIKIRDSNQLDINLTKLSANWQWEILKTFVSDVANKMLENAMKFNRDVYAKANDFIRLLKSIEMKKITHF